MVRKRHGDHVEIMWRRYVSAQYPLAEHTHMTLIGRTLMVDMQVIVSSAMACLVRCDR